MEDRAGVRSGLREDAAAVWPVFGISLRTPLLELRVVDPAIALDLARLSTTGIHDPESMPFAVPWTDAPAGDLARNSFRHYSLNWANWTPDRWTVMFAVFRDGELVGQQDAITHDYRTLRAFETGSWVARAHQGRGTGREMRAAVLHFLFDGLGALDAFTSAWEDNPASNAVTRALGYRDNGTSVGLQRDQRQIMRGYHLPRADWEARRRDDIEIHGLTDTALAEFGLAPDRTPLA